jgi:primosomal protein N' (replication factor Y)
LPVARVCVDIGLAHLDRPFDYLVPAELADQVVIGGRVRVRFSGQLVDGFVLDRVDSSDHAGKLAYLERALGREPVLAPEIAGAAREIADRYAGTLADVLRLAVPPRHARAETAAAATGGHLEAGASVQGVEVPLPPDGIAERLDGWSASWAGYPAGPALLRALAGGRTARAVWTAMPGEDWAARLAEAAAATVAGGRGAVLVVPDQRDLDRLDAALEHALGPGRHVALSAALGPAERYRRFLAARRGAVPVVAGTRAAALAPVDDLGLVAIWDDGDDLHAEPRAPYPHARETLLVRAERSGAAALLGGFGRTAEAQLLVRTGWAQQVTGNRAAVRARSARLVPAADDTELARDPAAAAARLPAVAWRAARAALAGGDPVLVQVPRRGYLPALACGRCRSPARCAACAGPLALSSGHAVATCRWCGRVAGDRTCPACGSRTLRASVVGARRTAEELGRAFPGVPVRTSCRDAVLASVPAEPALVVATPGAEPIVADTTATADAADPAGTGQPAAGYGAVLLLDGWALLSRADLRAAEEALRRWANAAALARAGGTVVITADGGLPVVQALLRWDPAGHAERELAERGELGFPPTVRMASVTGTPDSVAELLALAELPDGTETLGPVPVERDGTERMLLRVRRRDGRALATALHAAAGVRSARKAPDAVRVQVDPAELW